MAGLWEFPGGKLEPGEAVEACVIRELNEELGIAVRVERTLGTVVAAEADFVIELRPFLCRLIDPNAEPTARACDELRWVKPAQFADYAFPPANAPLLAEIESLSL